MTTGACRDRRWYTGDERNDPGFSDYEETRRRYSTGFTVPPAAREDVDAAERALDLEARPRSTEFAKQPIHACRAGVKPR